MTDGWQRRKIGDIAHHSLGKMLDKAKNRGEPRPYLRNLNVRWFEFDLSDLLEMRFLPSETERYTAVRGDVLVCEGGYPGRAAIWDHDEPVFFQKALHRVRFHEPEHAKWFVYYLYAKDLDGTLREHFGGTGIQHFTGEALARFELPLPSRCEVQRIVGVLDEAFDGIATARANTERNLQNARELLESQLRDVFDDSGEDSTGYALSDVCDIVSSLVDPRDAEYSDLVYVGGANIESKTGRLIDLRTAHEEGLISSKFVFNESMVLYSKIRPYLMKVARPEFRGLCSADIYPLLPRRDLLDRDFLYHLLLSPRFTEYAIAGSARAGMPKVNRDHLFEFRAFLPSIDRQRAIASQLDALGKQTSRLGSLYQRKLAALDELKRSLLHHAFTGQLTAHTLAEHSVP